MARYKSEPKPEARVDVAPESLQKVVGVQESERLQSEGWKVVGMTTRDGQKVHVLEKG